MLPDELVYILRYIESKLWKYNIEMDIGYICLHIYHHHHHHVREGLGAFPVP